MLVRDWMTFPVAGGEKLFHRAQYEVHPVVNSAYIRVTVA
ncbi:hypothetical protein JCM19236_3810 [Vibrio sp. JCM 19236]|nr:hypothetical protein JCM19236_3810 [Vibrio sp. JCM 19236]